MAKLTLILCLAMVSGSVLLQSSLKSQEIVVGEARINGGRIYYETLGTGQDVILIHGFTLDHRMWEPQFEQLAKKYRVTRFDLRGHGKSSAATDRFNPVDDLRALMDTLRIDQAHVIGLSLGGEIAADFALAHPNRALSMTLIDAYYLIDSVEHEEFADRIGKYLELAQTQSLEAGLREWFNDPLFASARTNEMAKQSLEQMVTTGHLAQGQGALFAKVLNVVGPDNPATEKLSDFDMPTLVIVGELDLRMFHQVADRFAEGINNARKVVVPEAGHMSNMENPEFVTETLLTFLESASNE